MRVHFLFAWGDGRLSDGSRARRRRGGRARDEGCYRARAKGIARGYEREDGGGGSGTHATMRLSSLSWVKLPTTLCVTLVGFCACATRRGKDSRSQAGA